jgi:large subunit ribosomal protein L9
MAKSPESKSAKASAKKPAARKTGGKAPTAVAAPPRQPGVERRKNHPLRAKLGAMQVILTHDVVHVGKAGDLVKVRPGFARNFLIPQGLATFATPHNLRIVERHRERLRQLEEAKKTELRGLAGQIAKQSITIEANANAEGHLYGSVSADMIAAALRAHNLPVQDEHVQIEGPLKELGLYTIHIHLAPEIDTEVKLWVVPTHSEEAPA